jgi:hypothetical protein
MFRAYGTYLCTYPHLGSQVEPHIHLTRPLEDFLVTALREAPTLTVAARHVDL